MKALFAIFSVLALTFVANADQSFQAYGTVRKITAYGGITYYKLDAGKDRSFFLVKESGEAAFKRCKTGTFELVASSPLPTNKTYVILSAMDCHN